MSPLPTPKQLHKHLPLREDQRTFLASHRAEAIDILQGDQSRLIIFAGPCSIHSPTLALEYGAKIKALADQVSDQIFLIMRVFLEKPRTHFGWKGFLYDPFLDGSQAVGEGLYRSRDLLLNLASLNIPIATEFLDPLLFSYYSDLITWGIIGARTSASQIHRQMASELPIPVGFKNDTHGQVDNAIFGALAANRSQVLTGINADGQLCTLKSKGNPNTHLILRGSVNAPNYDPLSIAQAIQKQRLLGLHSPLVVDCAHGNSQNRDDKQQEVFQAIFDQRAQGNHLIMGMMLESHLKGSDLLSLTDPCLNWEATAELVLSAHENLKPLLSQELTKQVQSRV